MPARGCRGQRRERCLPLRCPKLPVHRRVLHVSCACVSPRPLVSRVLGVGRVLRERANAALCCVCVCSARTPLTLAVTLTVGLVSRFFGGRGRCVWSECFLRLASWKKHSAERPRGGWGNRDDNSRALPHSSSPAFAPAPMTTLAVRAACMASCVAVPMSLPLLPDFSICDTGLALAMEAAGACNAGALEAAAVVLHRSALRHRCAPSLKDLVHLVLAVTAVPVTVWAPQHPRAMRRAMWLLLCMVSSTPGAAKELAVQAAATARSLPLRLQEVVVHLGLADGEPAGEHFLEAALGQLTAACVAAEAPPLLWTTAELAGLLGAAERFTHSVAVLNGIAQVVCCVCRGDVAPEARIDAATALLRAGALAVGLCPKKTGTAAARLAKAAAHMLADLPRCEVDGPGCPQCAQLCSSVVMFAKAWPHSLPAFHHLCLFLQLWAAHVGPGCVSEPDREAVNAALTLALCQVESTQDVIAHVFAMNASWPWPLRLAAPTHAALLEQWRDVVLDVAAPPVARAQAAGLLLAVHAQEGMPLDAVPMLAHVLGAEDAAAAQPAGALVSLALAALAMLMNLATADACACMVSFLHKCARCGALQAAARSEPVFQAYEDAAAEVCPGKEWAVARRGSLPAMHDLDSAVRDHLVTAMESCAPSAARAPAAFKLFVHCAVSTAAWLDPHHSQAWVNLLSGLRAGVVAWPPGFTPDCGTLAGMRAATLGALDGPQECPSVVVIAVVNVGLAMMCSATRMDRLLPEAAATAMGVLERVLVRAAPSDAASAADSAFVAKVLHWVANSLEGGFPVLAFQTEALKYLLTVCHADSASPGARAVIYKSLTFPPADSQLAKLARMVAQAPAMEGMPAFAGAFAPYAHRSAAVASLAEWLREQRRSRRKSPSPLPATLKLSRRSKRRA